MQAYALGKKGKSKGKGKGKEDKDEYDDDCQIWLGKPNFA
jgi:hypothetical protein